MNLTQKGKDEMMASTELIDTILSAHTLSEHLILTLQRIVEAVTEMCDNLNQTFMIVMICVVVLWPFCNFFIGRFSINAQNQNGEKIYQAFTNIPKNHVSANLTRFQMKRNGVVSDSFQFFVDAISELNKAEEKMINTFLNASDSTSSTHDVLPHLLTFCNIATHIANTIIIYSLYSNMSSEIKKEAPHIQRIFETISSQVSASLCFYLYADIKNEIGVMNLSTSVLYQRYSRWGRDSLSSFDESRYGNDTADVHPFETFGKAIHQFNINYQCSEEKSNNVPREIPEYLNALHQKCFFILLMES
jgi:hypothetical protein